VHVGRKSQIEEKINLCTTIVDLLTCTVYTIHVRTLQDGFRRRYIIDYSIQVPMQVFFALYKEGGIR